MIQRALALTLALACWTPALAEETATLDDVRFLVGEFEGKGQHPWGEYDESFSGAWTLGDTTIELRSESKMGPQTVFTDLRVVTFDKSKKTLRMRQFSADLLREYTGTKNADGAVVFTQTSHEGPSDDVWRYTLTAGDDGGFAYAVEARPVGSKATDTTAWKPYVSGTLSAHLKDPSKGGGLGMRQYDATIEGMDAEIHHPDGAGPYPAIVFSPGGNASSTSGYAPYGRWYATWGYITVVVAFDDGDAPKRAPKFSKIADWLTAENTRDGSPLKGMIDTKRLAAAGHSRGGFGALLATRSDARFVATMAFAPSGPKTPAEGAGSARTLVVVGEKDEYLPAGKSAFGVTAGERVLIEIAGMTHMLGPREQTLRLVARSTAFLEYAFKGDTRYRDPLIEDAAGLTIETAD